VVLEAGDGAVFRSPGHYTVTNTATRRGQILALGAPVEAYKAPGGGGKAEAAPSGPARKAKRHRPRTTGPRSA
jgi:hypothetical protein